MLAALGASAVGATTVVAAQQGQGGEQPIQEYRLGGRVAGWQGQRPEEIAGQTNPTLSLQAGQMYAMTWENLDGVPHNFAFQDSEGNNLPVILPEAAGATGENATAQQNATGGDGNQTGDDAGEVKIRILPGESPLEDVAIGGPDVNQTDSNATAGNRTRGNVTGAQMGTETDTPVNNTTDGMAANQTATEDGQLPPNAISKTDTVSEQGATQSFRFVAVEEMATYICPIHPTTMVGDVQIPQREEEETRTPSGI